MARSVVIDCLPESVSRYRRGYAVVAIDVVRATTTAITAAATGRRCFVVPTVSAAFDLAGRHENTLLLGEQAGIMPSGFDLNNSPAAVAELGEIERPAILLSSSGTRLCHEALQCDASFLACLRNFTSAAVFLDRGFQNVVVIGAGSHGEFREEDEMCCAWIAERLADFGYRPRGETTRSIIEKWKTAPADAWLRGNSAAYLRNSGQIADLNFIRNHIDDLQAVFRLRNGEVVMESRAAIPASRTTGLESVA